MRALRLGTRPRTRLSRFGSRKGGAIMANESVGGTSAKASANPPAIAFLGEDGDLPATAGKCLYLFFDEAGDFSHSCSSSRFFILTCAITVRPFDCADSLISMRRDLLEEGVDIEYFHASDNYKWIRARVFEAIRERSSDFTVYYAAVEKEAAGGFAAGDIYCKLFDSLFGLISLDIDISSASQVIAVTDLLPSDVRKKAYMKRLKEILGRSAAARYTIGHHRSMSDTNLQIADYYCWAVQRSIEHGDPEQMRGLPAIRKGILFAAEKEQGPS